MANPMPADSFLKALLTEGLTVVQEGSWREHNRNHKGAWGPVNGVMIHHTVTKGTAATVRIVRDGYADLPGPLCHGMIAKDGRVHLVGYGRTNHAGLGDGDVLAAVIAERPLPADNKANTDGNRHFFGFECENLGDGKDPWPAVQLDSIERAAAAICRYYGWGAASVIGHLEWQPGKVDPRGFTMASMRDRIETRIAHPASWNGSTLPTEDDMTPAQEAMLKQLVTDVAALKKNAARAAWTYRNPDQDAASQKAGHRIPDMHGRIEDLQRDLTTAIALLKKGA